MSDRPSFRPHSQNPHIAYSSHPVEPRIITSELLKKLTPLATLKDLEHLVGIAHTGSTDHRSCVVTLQQSATDLRLQIQAQQLLGACEVAPEPGTTTKVFAFFGVLRGHHFQLYIAKPSSTVHGELHRGPLVTFDTLDSTKSSVSDCPVRLKHFLIVSL